MWISKVEIAGYEARIKELENIICPAEQHGYVVAVEKSEVIDGHGTTLYHRRYVCKRCMKEIKRTDFI
jgi:hypothetical protein